MNTPRVCWLLAALWAGLIFWLSSSPDAQGGGWLLTLVPFGDKLAHGVAFGVLAALVYRATGRATVGVAVASLYGVSDELHQQVVPGRSLDAADWLADTLGAVVSVALVRFLTRPRPPGAEPVQ